MLPTSCWRKLGRSTRMNKWSGVCWRKLYYNREMIDFVTLFSFLCT
jgi:hypothetical protein